MYLLTQKGKFTNDEDKYKLKGSE